MVICLLSVANADVKAAERGNFMGFYGLNVNCYGEPVWTFAVEVYDVVVKERVLLELLIFVFSVEQLNGVGNY